VALEAEQDRCAIFGPDQAVRVRQKHAVTAAVRVVDPPQTPLNLRTGDRSVTLP
jgi:hypothetical protein